MSGQTVLNANKRYCRDFSISIGLHIAAVIGTTIYIQTGLDSRPKWVMATLAVLCALPATAIILLMIRLLHETDEYMRQRFSDALIAAIGMTVAFCFFWGFLALYGIVPNMDTFLVGPLFFSCLGLVQVYLSVFRHEK